MEIKYNYADFTRENYRKLLKLAKKNYIFRNYEDFNKNERFVLWRHDIDVSVHSAAKLAKIESEEEIVSTYFIWLHSHMYHFGEKKIFEKIRRIINLGHKIGLHFDFSFYDKKLTNDFEYLLEKEKKVLEEEFNTEVTVFSFHDPTEQMLKFNDSRYAGMINTYSSYFKNNVAYCSDSNGYWRFRRLEDVLREAKEEKLQILTHPVWWQETAMSPQKRIWRSIDGRAENNKKLYDKYLKSLERKNIE